jgi:type IV secretion system protein VirB10
MYTFRGATALLAGFLSFAEEKPVEARFRVDPGTKIPLSMINSVSTKSAVAGDRVYLESVFPILVDGKVVVPPGSYVAGTVTQVQRAGRIRGRSELYVRFDSLTLPNGVTREFRSRLGNVDGTVSERLDREEGKLEGNTNRGGDARTVGEAAAGGVTAGAIAGSASGHGALGAGVGAAAGAAAGLIGILVTRGPEAVLARGTTVEMVLDRPIDFTETELDFSRASSPPRRSSPSPVPADAKSTRRPLPVPGVGLPGTRIP